MTMRINLGTILGPLRHLPIEIIARIREEAAITRRLEHIVRVMNHWIQDVADYINPLVHPDETVDWVLGLVQGVNRIRQRENSIRRLRE